MDALSDMIRERVAPLAGPFCGYPVMAAMEARGWRFVRGYHAVVDSGWLADVLVELNQPVRRDRTLGEKAAMYDKLVDTLNRKGRGRI